MYYDVSITVPANTAQSSPVTQMLTVTSGIIQRVEVQFPIGTLALMHCQILHHEHQLWPTNRDGSFASDGYVISFDEYYELKTEPYELKIITWNLDDTYQHILTVRIGILRSEDIKGQSSVTRRLETFLRLVGVRG